MSNSAEQMATSQEQSQQTQLLHGSGDQTPASAARLPWGCLAVLALLCAGAVALIGAAASRSSMPASSQSQNLRVHYVSQLEEPSEARRQTPKLVYKDVSVYAPSDLTFVKWSVAGGDLVAEGDPLLVAQQGDQEVELKVHSGGTIRSILADAHPGDVIPKGTQLAVIGHPPARTLDFVTTVALIAFFGSAIICAGLSLQSPPEYQVAVTRSPEDDASALVVALERAAAKASKRAKEAVERAAKAKAAAEAVAKGPDAQTLPSLPRLARAAQAARALADTEEMEQVRI